MGSTREQSRAHLTLLSIVRNICPLLAVLPQLVAILLYTACRLSLDSVASTPPVVPSFLAHYLCAAISCGDVSNAFKATEQIREGQGEEVSSNLNGRDLMQLCRYSTSKMTNAISPGGS